MKSILYINKKNKDKVTKVKSIAFLNKIKIDSAASDEVEKLPDNAELLIMRDFNRNEMSSFLSALRSKGITIELKCVETETNKQWSICKLYEEIKKEHETFQTKRSD